MRCDECVHWDLDEDTDMILNQTIGNCRKAVMFWDATKWSDDRDGRVAMDPHQLMYVQDASDYFAGLFTDASFFCAHWCGKTPVEAVGCPPVNEDGA